jgi:hypothetical protein
LRFLGIGLLEERAEDRVKGRGGVLLRNGGHGGIRLRPTTCAARSDSSRAVAQAEALDLPGGGEDGLVDRWHEVAPERRMYGDLFPLEQDFPK